MCNLSSSGSGSSSSSSVIGLDNNNNPTTMDADSSSSTATAAAAAPSIPVAVAAVEIGIPMQDTFAMIKPITSEIAGADIMSVIAANGFEVVAELKIKLTLQQAEAFYAEHLGKVGMGEDESLTHTRCLTLSLAHTQSLTLSPLPLTHTHTHFIFHSLPLSLSLSLSHTHTHTFSPPHPPTPPTLPYYPTYLPTVFLRDTNAIHVLRTCTSASPTPIRRYRRVEASHRTHQHGTRPGRAAGLDPMRLRDGRYAECCARKRLRD